MCPSERYTQRRGRSGVPSIRVRTRWWTRWRCKSRDSLRTLADATCVSPKNQNFRLEESGVNRHYKNKLRCCAASLRARFTSLLLQALAGNAHAFLLVGIGWTKRTHISSNLPNLALIRTTDDDVRLLVHSHLNAFRNP